MVENEGRTVIVPNYIANAINRKLDEQFKLHPNAEKDHEFLYKQLISYFDEHGVIPEFTLGKKGG